MDIRKDNPLLFNVHNQIIQNKDNIEGLYGACIAMHAALKRIRSAEAFQECNDGFERLSPLTYGQIREIAFKVLEDIEGD